MSKPSKKKIKRWIQEAVEKELVGTYMGPKGDPGPPGVPGPAGHCACTPYVGTPDYWRPLKSPTYPDPGYPYNRPLVTWTSRSGDTSCP